MPDLLIIYKNQDEGIKLSELGQSLGYRVKSTPEIGMALNWLRLRGFDAALVDAGTSIEIQQELGGMLWQHNPRAMLFAYDLNETAQTRRQMVRLYGAEMICGKDALNQLREQLGSFKPELEPKRGDFNVLVVEDLDAPRDILCLFIESLGFATVEGKASAKQAMAELNANPGKYSCVVTDIRMPEISGDLLIEYIRQSPKLKHLPVVVLTAHGTADCLLKCMLAGASGFLVKPPKRQDLLRELSRALRISSGKKNPRLVNPEDSDTIKQILSDRSFD